jgi:hypothetical protein
MPEGKRKAATETEFRFLSEDYANRLLDFDGPSAAEWGKRPRGTAIRSIVCWPPARQGIARQRLHSTAPLRFAP